MGKSSHDSIKCHILYPSSGDCYTSNEIVTDNGYITQQALDAALGKMELLSRNVRIGYWLTMPEKLLVPNDASELYFAHWMVETSIADRWYIQQIEASPDNTVV